METLKKIDNKRPYFWWASNFMERLDYKDWHTFTHLVEETVRTMIMIEIPYYENIIPTDNNYNGKTIIDFKLSLFACYLIVMLADHKKKKVVEVQTSFAKKEKQYGIQIKGLYELERLRIRKELSESSKWLNSMVAKSEIKDYSAFNDAGYQGFYGMHSSKLHDWRKLPKNIGQQEYMGQVELAANLFRITLTEQHIWSEKIKGQTNLEKVHFDVGIGIRNLIKKHSGKYPEQLPVYKDLTTLKKLLKESCQKMTGK